jgi:protein phosphatase inhibitor 2
MTNRHGKIDLAALNAQLKVELAKYKVENSGVKQEETETEEERKKKEEFKKKRAAHYNEFKMIQLSQNNKWESDDDDS